MGVEIRPTSLPVSRSVIDDFLAQRTLAVAGVSRSGRGFGNAACRELTAKGYSLRVVHPDAPWIGPWTCAPTVAEVAHEVGGLLLVTPPAATFRLSGEAIAAGIRRIWMQQGAECDEAVRLCLEHGIDVVHGQCILMFAEPAGFVHRGHRWVNGLFGRLPH